MDIIYLIHIVYVYTHSIYKYMCVSDMTFSHVIQKM